MGSSRDTKIFGIFEKQPEPGLRLDLDSRYKLICPNQFRKYFPPVISSKGSSIVAEGKYAYDILLPTPWDKRFAKMHLQKHNIFRQMSIRDLIDIFEKP